VTELDKKVEAANKGMLKAFCKIGIGPATLH
jgi:hypothetical protein